MIDVGRPYGDLTRSSSELRDARFLRLIELKGIVVGLEVLRAFNLILLPPFFCQLERRAHWHWQENERRRMGLIEPSLASRSASVVEDDCLSGMLTFGSELRPLDLSSHRVMRMPQVECIFDCNEERLMKLLALVALCGSLLAGAEAAEITARTSEFLYESAPFPSCHASTIVETANGRLVTAFFAGTQEKHPDVGIWVCRLVDRKWTAPVEVANGVQADGKRHPCWNPILFQPRATNGAAAPLILFYKVGPSPSTWWGELKTSTDDGQTWSDARRLPDGILGPIKNKPVQLPNGDILSGTSTEHAGWRVHFERSSDLGKTWTATAPVNDGKAIGAIQPSILFLGGDKLLAVGRTQQKRVFQIASNDGGKTWGEMSLTSLPNPNSGTDAVTLSDGRQLLVFNNTEKGRSPLNVAISKDAAQWDIAAALETEPGEYSYPAVIQTKDGTLHVTYTWKRQRVKHVTLDVK